MNKPEQRLNEFSFQIQAWRKFKSDKMAFCGLLGVFVIFSLAIFAPLLANGRPFIFYGESSLSFPFLRYIFAPDGSETIVEKIFNYFIFLLPITAFIHFFWPHKYLKFKNISILTVAIILSIPFFIVKKRMDKTNWLQLSKNTNTCEIAIFAPIPYGPFENVSPPFQKSTWKHLLGTDHVGRDVLSRLLYGARVSLAVGVMSTLIALLIGTSTGMIAAYFGNKTDMILMRIVEIIICFPTFLLLLIIMAIMTDYSFDQSVLLVIAVIGLTSWTGLSRLVRGEVLKQRSLPYIQSCISLGIPTWRIMLLHLLPNVMGVIIVTFTFSIASAIIAESGLSFLGFGVKAPTASWGELLKQAFTNPFNYWHLTLWPGLALFLTVSSFNFTGEGLRRVLDPKA